MIGENDSPIIEQRCEGMEEASGRDDAGPLLGLEPATPPIIENTRENLNPKEDSNSNHRLNPLLGTIFLCDGVRRFACAIGPIGGHIDRIASNGARSCLQMAEGCRIRAFPRDERRSCC